SDAKLGHKEIYEVVEIVVGGPGKASSDPGGEAPTSPFGPPPQRGSSGDRRGPRRRANSRVSSRRSWRASSVMAPKSVVATRRPGITYISPGRLATWVGPVKSNDEGI